MKSKGRLLSLAAACSALACACPAAAVTQNATVNATVVKPLTLSWIQDLDLGTITIKPGTFTGANVAITRNGAFSCAAALICTGPTQVAKYKVTGANRQTVLISAPNVTMVNQADASKTLTLVVDGPGQVVLTSSGQPGIIFPLGGSIALSSTTATGDYRGTFNVTVDYQ